MVYLKGLKKIFTCGGFKTYFNFGLRNPLDPLKSKVKWGPWNGAIKPLYSIGYAELRKF